MAKIIELCPYCEKEVKLANIPFVPQKCPNCGKMIKACSLCEWDTCDCDACEKKYCNKKEKLPI